MQKDPIKLLKSIREDKYKYYDRGGDCVEELVVIIKNLDKRLQNLEDKPRKDSDDSESGVPVF